MITVTQVRLDISGYAEGTGTELSQDLVAWLSPGFRQRDEPVVRADSQDPEVASLFVTLPEYRLEDLSRSLVAWGRDRRLNPAITFKLSIPDGKGTVGLRSWASDEEIEHFVFELGIGRLTPGTVEVRSGASDEEIEHFFATVGVLADEIRLRGMGVRFAFAVDLADLDFRPTGFDRGVEEPDASMMPITIYLSDEGIHEQVETAVEVLLATAGLQIETRDDPIVGSWFRQMRAIVKEAARSSAAREATLVAAHMADTRLVLAQDAAVTATLLQNLGPVLGALQPTKDAVIRAGALLIVKVDWTVHVFQLTAAQQAVLDHATFQLDRSPSEIITALNLTPEDHQNDGHPELT